MSDGQKSPGNNNVHRDIEHLQPASNGTPHIDPNIKRIPVDKSESNQSRNDQPRNYPTRPHPQNSMHEAEGHQQQGHQQHVHIYPLPYTNPDGYKYDQVPIYPLPVQTVAIRKSERIWGYKMSRFLLVGFILWAVSYIGVLFFNNPMILTVFSFLNLIGFVILLIPCCAGHCCCKHDDHGCCYSEIDP